MISKRIIPCLDVKNGRVVKGVNFEGIQDVADPVEMAEFYNQSGADELVFYDITASVEGRKIFTDILTEAAKRVFIPLTVGGGISTLDDFEPRFKMRRGQGQRPTAARSKIRSLLPRRHTATAISVWCFRWMLNVLETNTTYLSRAGVSIQALMRWNGQNPASDAAQASWWSTVSIPMA